MKTAGNGGTKQTPTERLDTEFNHVPGDGHSSCESHEMFRGGEEFALFEEGEANAGPGEQGKGDTQEGAS